MPNFFEQVAISIDQNCNAVLYGWADETLSSRAYRSGYLKDKPKKRWVFMYGLIDKLFFWQATHCESAYKSELKRKHLPPSMRETDD